MCLCWRTLIWIGGGIVWPSALEKVNVFVASACNHASTFGYTTQGFVLMETPRQHCVAVLIPAPCLSCG